MTKAIQSQKALLCEITNERDVAVERWRSAASENAQLREQVSRLLTSLSSTQAGGGRTMFELLTQKGLLDMSLLQRRNQQLPGTPEGSIEESALSPRRHLSQFDVNKTVMGSPSLVMSSFVDPEGYGTHSTADVWTPNKWSSVTVDGPSGWAKSSGIPAAHADVSTKMSMSSRHSGKQPNAGPALERPSQALLCVAGREDFIQGMQQRLLQYSCSSTAVRRRCKVERWDDAVGRWRQRVVTVLPPGIIVDEGSGVSSTGFGTSSKRALEGTTHIQRGRFSAVGPAPKTRMQLLLSTFSEDMLLWSVTSPDLRRMLAQILPESLLASLGGEETYRGALEEVTEDLKGRVFVHVEVHQGVEGSLKSTLTEGGEGDSAPGIACFYVRCTVRFAGERGTQDSQLGSSLPHRSLDVVEQFRTSCSSDAVRWVRALQSCLKHNRNQSFNR